MSPSSISIIVPIFKVEPYIHKCINSILGQTYSNLQIILVDDGSPDHCPEICDEYAVKDSRIKVIHKENGGLSDARNAGLDIATGDWISFIDSDDWIEPQMYESLLRQAMQYQADISVGGVNDELLNDGSITVLKTTQTTPSKTWVYTNTESMKHYFHSSWSSWDKIYKANLFKNIRFPVGEINEDEAIVLQLLDKCNKIVYTNKVFYHYIHRPSSITTSSFSSKKFAWYRHCRDNLAWISEKYPDLIPDAAARYRGALTWTLTEVALSDTPYPAEQEDMLNELHANRKLFRMSPLTSTKEKIRFVILSYLPFSLYRFLIRRKRKA